MKGRITRDTCNIQIAGIIAQRGTCKRLQVGCVITLNNRIVATGYNGPSATMAHCNDFICRTDNPCQRAIHAEENALINLQQNWNTIGYDFKLYCTHQPCEACAKKIIAFKHIKDVIYQFPYRDDTGLNLLIANGIKVKFYNGKETEEQV